MSELNRMLKAGGGAYTTATFKRYVEEMGQPLIEQGIRGALTHNNAIRAMLTQLIEKRDTRISVHAFISMVGALISEYGDDLWSGRQDPFTKVLRAGLKGVAPTLNFASDVTADALERALDTTVDRQFAPTPDAPKGALDESFAVFIGYDGVTRLLVPLYRQDGTVVIDPQTGDLIPANPEIHSVFYDSIYTQTSERQERGSGKNAQSRTVKVPPQKRNIVFPLTLAQALEMVKSQPGRMDPEQLELIERLLAPTKAWESQILPSVDTVLSWLNDALSVPGLDLAQIKRSRQEVEDLLTSMLRQRPNPEWVNRRLGRFSDECEVLVVTTAGPYTQGQRDAISHLINRICDEVDNTLRGEQSPTTKALKLSKLVPEIYRQASTALSQHAPWFTSVVVWWLYSMVGALTLLILGVFLPPEGVPVLAPVLLCVTAIVLLVKLRLSGVWMAGTMVALALMLFGAEKMVALVVMLSGTEGFNIQMWEVGLYCSAIGAVLGFVFSWPFPFLQTGINVIRTFVPQLSEDGITDLGRRIALFGMSTGGILCILNWIQMPSSLKVLSIAMVLMAMGSLFGYKILNKNWMGDEVALSALKKVSMITGSVMILAVLLTVHGRATNRSGGPMSGPELFRWTKTEILDSGYDWVKNKWNKPKSSVAPVLVPTASVEQARPLVVPAPAPPPTATPSKRSDLCADLPAYQRNDKSICP